MKTSYTSLAVALLLLAGTVQAQPPQRGGPPLERVERFKKVRLVEMLDLKEDQSVRFFARLNDHEKVKRELMKSKMDVLDRIERLIRNNADEKEYHKLFPDVAEADRKIFDEDQKFFAGLSDLLTVEQQAKYLLFERRFEQELREAMREIQRKRRGMGE